MMKKAMICMLALLAVGAAAAQGTLSVEVTGIEQAEGHIMVAVYGQHQEFLEEDFVLSYKAKVGLEAEQVVELELNFGRYAVAIYQDLDGDAELDTNFIGIPKEPYGFSCNCMGVMGPPDFEKASFDFSKDGQQITISL
ncbi:MAG: DUF2141 domain-containing protein [Cyclobacteriaceae bacterium]